MGRFNKKFILIIMLLGIFLLTGCNKLSYNNASDEGNSSVTVVPDDSQSDMKDATNITPTTEPDSNSKANATTAAQQELPIYTVDTQGGSGNIMPVTALVPGDSELTPEFIVDKVVESLADQSIKIGIDSVTTKKNAVIVSFIKKEAPYQNMGSEYEINILNAFAQSLIDNLKDCEKVIFRIEGKAYESGSLEYGIDEPYMEK